MIAIVNQGEKNTIGETLYFVYINREFIAKFWHKRSNGLSACLKLASIATKDRKYTK